MAKFLFDKGYVNEALFIQTVYQWHVASDGRGVSQLQRCKYNYAILNYLLDELMPWHNELYDFSTLEVNQ